MRGIRINFNDGSFDFSAPARDFETAVQNALVNVATDQGSDPLYPERGTNLLLDGVSGRLINNAWANHSANFAAVQTLVFCQTVDDPSDDHRLSNFLLAQAKIVGQKLTLSAQAVAADGQRAGLITEV